MSVEETGIHDAEKYRSTLAARAELAQRHGEAGDVVTAAAAYAELLPAMLQVFGPDHRETLAARAHLAWWRSLTPPRDSCALTR